MIVDWGGHCKWAALLKSSNTTVAGGMKNGWCESRRLLIYDGLWLMNAEDHGSSSHMTNIESAAVHCRALDDWHDTVLYFPIEVHLFIIIN